MQTREALIADKGVAKLLGMMPENVQESFTDVQLANLKLAIDANSWKKHSIDIRSTFSFFSYRYYYLLIAGREQRQMSRGELRFKRLTYLLFLGLFITFSTLLGILVLYLIKSAMGIDLFANFSLGIWDWFKASFLQG